ncbi:hypothetical protein BX600DRAFT_441136 [Xylariales sp. PMI_506]|nr:hypothetical protein BX600DRAFT_441136 [Xylariales sp. PMI_506]
MVPPIYLRIFTGLSLLLFICLVTKAEDESDFEFVTGNTNSTLYGVPAASWLDAIAHPNASYCLSVAAVNLSISVVITPDLYNLSISVAATIALQDTTNATLDQSQVFTGTQVRIQPNFLQRVPSDVEWEACFYFGSPSLKQDATQLQDVTGQEMCDKLTCSYDWSNTFMGGLFNTTGYLSCASAAEYFRTLPCADSWGWDAPYMISKHNIIL